MKLVPIFVHLFPMIICNTIMIRDLRQDPLLVLKTTDCRLQTGNIKLVHPVNLTDLQRTIDKLHHTYIQTIDRDSSFNAAIKHRIMDLHFAINQIKPRRHKRWDALGAAWKWLAGSPDADDLRLINSSINNLVDNSNTQIRINDGINNRLTKLTSSLNILIEANRQSMNDSQDLAAMKLLINIDLIDDVLKNIQDAILGTKIGLPTPRFLTQDELESAASILEQQGITFTMLEEALNFVEPKVAVKNDQLLYIMQIPQVDEQPTSVVEIIPVPIYNQVIINIPKFVIKKDKTIFSTTTPLAVIQKHSYLTPVNDSCVRPLLLGQPSSCDTMAQYNSTAVLIADDKILVTNAVNLTLQSNCSPTKTLNNNVLVIVDNCELQIANKSFKITTTSTKTDIPNLFYDAIIKTREIKQYDLAQINATSIENGRILEHINLKQYQQNYWMYALFGITLLIVLAGAATIFLTLQHPPAIQHQQSSEATPSPTLAMKLLDQTLTKLKTNVDARSPPPGGVTCD